MKIIMLSIDKGLLGKNPLGDVIERHKKYGEFCERLDIVVLNKKDCHPELVSGSHPISQTVTAYPINSKNKLFYYFDALKIAKKLFVQNQYDLIICQEPFLTGLIGAQLKKKFKSKLLIHFHGDFRLPLWSVVKKADGLRVMSSGQKEKLIKKGIDANKIFVIPTPVNLEKFTGPLVCHPDELKVALMASFDQDPEKKDFGFRVGSKLPVVNLNGMTKNILFIGRLESVKNLSWFLDVFKNISEKYTGQVKLIIAGAGSEEINLKNKVKKLNLENLVDFIGSVTYDELPNYLATCNILVLPSLSESFGKVLIEAGVCGKPVVATMTTGAKEIVESGVTGFLTPIGDAQAMTEAVLKLLNNSNLAEKMGTRAREHIKENFDGQKNLQKIKEMWYTIITKN